MPFVQYCVQTTDPHIIRFSAEDKPWDGLAYLRQPLFWRWDRYRTSLINPYGDQLTLWIMLLLPFTLLCGCSFLLYRGSSAEPRRGGGTGGGVDASEGAFQNVNSSNVNIDDGSVSFGTAGSAALALIDRTIVDGFLTDSADSDGRSSPASPTPSSTPTRDQARTEGTGAGAFGGDGGSPVGHSGEYEADFGDFEMGPLEVGEAGSGARRDGSRGVYRLDPLSRAHSAPNTCAYDGSGRGGGDIHREPASPASPPEPKRATTGLLDPYDRAAPRPHDAQPHSPPTMGRVSSLPAYPDATSGVHPDVWNEFNVPPGVRATPSSGSVSSSALARPGFSTAPSMLPSSRGAAGGRARGRGRGRGLTLSSFLRDLRGASITGLLAAGWYFFCIDLARALVEVSWHPVAAVLVYQVWLCLLLVIGLTGLDYVHNLSTPRFRPKMLVR